MLIVNCFSLLSIAIVFGLWIFEQNNLVKNLSAKPKVSELVVQLKATSIVELVDDYMIDGDGIFNGFSIEHRKLKFEIDSKVIAHKILLAQRRAELNVKIGAWSNSGNRRTGKLTYRCS